MKKKLLPILLALTTWAGAALGTVGASALETGCTPAQGKQAENTLIDSATAECAVLNADLPEPALQKACKITDTMLPIVRNLIGATHKKLAASHCQAVAQ